MEVVTDVAGATAIPWEWLRDPQTNTPLAPRAGVRARQPPARPAAGTARPDGGAAAGAAGDLPAGRRRRAVPLVASHLVRVSDDARQVFDLDGLRPPTLATPARHCAAAGRGQPYDVVHFDRHGTWAAVHRVDRSRARLLIGHLLSG